MGSRLAKASLRIQELEAELDNHKDQREALLREIHRHHELLVQTHRQLAQSQATVQTIYASRGWKWLTRYYRVRNLLLPAGSRRRRVLATVLKTVKKLAGGRSQDPGVRSQESAPSLTPAPCLLTPDPGPSIHAADPAYARWIERYEPGAAELNRQRQVRFAREVRLSLLVPQGDAPEPLLEALLRSLLDQTYANWEMVIVRTDAGAPEPAAPARAANVKILSLSAGASAAERSNAALVAATGEYVALLQAGDALAPFALFEIVQALNHHPDADFLYSDEDWRTETGGLRADPHFKPDWSPDTLRSHNYLGQLAVFSRLLLEQAGGLGDGLDGGDNYDLVLRVSERAGRIVHLPRVLYHRRGPKDEAKGRDEAACKALAEHLHRLGLAAEVRPGLRPDTYQVAHSLPARPLVSVIIPNRDSPEMLARCIDSLGRSSYPETETIIVENGSQQPETFACYRRLAGQWPWLRLLTWDKPFNYAAINNFAAKEATGDVLLFLNNDVQVINPDWLERLLEHVLRPAVAAAGAKLYYPDHTIQHAGIIVGRDHGPCHNLVFADGNAAGYGQRLVTVQNVSAVTGACLMTRKAVFAEVGGFEEAFAVAFNDIDYCLKLRRRGYLVVWTPFAQLYHFESVTRGYLDTPVEKAKNQHELRLFQEKWQPLLPSVDPYYNPNLTLGRPDCSLRD
jgi:GT2 family glycosyltransferase